MKKILVISLAIILCGSMAYAAYNSPGSGDIMAKGTIASDAGKIFRLVRYVPTSGGLNSTTITAESVVVWDGTSCDGVTVTTTTTTSDLKAAGIVVADITTPESLGNIATADLGKRNWGYIQTYGFARAQCASEGLPQAGGLVGTTAAPRLVGSTSTTGATIGFSFDTATAQQEVRIFLRGLD